MYAFLENNVFPGEVVESIRAVEQGELLGDMLREKWELIGKSRLSEH